MPSQWELETAERLGSIDANIKQLLDVVAPQVRSHGDRISKLERAKAYALGWYAGVSVVVVVLGWIVAHVAIK